MKIIGRSILRRCYQKRVVFKVFHCAWMLTMHEGQQPIIEIDSSISERMTFKYQIAPASSSKCQAVHPKAFVLPWRLAVTCFVYRTKSHGIICEILGSQGDKDSSVVLLGCDAPKWNNLFIMVAVFKLRKIKYTMAYITCNHLEDKFAENVDLQSVSCKM